MSPRATGRFAVLHRLPAALVWPTLIQLLLLAINAHAAKFDERVSPPPDISPSGLHKKFKKQFATMKEPGGMTKLMRDKAAHNKWVDAQWQLGESIDRRLPMPQLAEFGMVMDENGVYSVDFAEHPEWFPMEDRMWMYLTGNAYRFTREQLRQRGFREEDIQVLDEYLSAHDVDATQAAAHLELTLDFGEQINKAIKRGRTTARAGVVSFTYQCDRTRREVTRTWAIGAFDVLDLQRQRILESFMMEQVGSRTISPTNREQAIDDNLRIFGSGEYIQMLEPEKERVLP
jgi:hypothetical protein